MRHADLIEDSAAFRKAEVHHRVVEDVEGEIVQTIRQSAELLARHDGDVNTRGKHRDGKWLKCKIKTDQWEKIGFPRLNADILIKLYYPDDPDAVSYPLDQPKLEVALDGKETVIDDETGQQSQKMIPWDRWDEIMAILEEILLSHLEWADVSAADLVADDYSAGAQNPRTRWKHPEGRRYWLRKHYESLVPALYREATRTRTDLVLDILDTVRKRGRVSYDDLMDATGAARRTIREHVRRLDDDVGGDDPGLLDRDRGAKTWVSFSSRFLEELSETAVDSIYADREELPEDGSERADERLADHLRDYGLDDDHADALVEAIDGDRVYGRGDLRDADREELREIVEDLDLEVDLVALGESEDEPEDDETEDDETEETDDGRAQWETFDGVPLDADALAYALVSDAPE